MRNGRIGSISPTWSLSVSTVGAVAAQVWIAELVISVRCLPLGEVQGASAGGNGADISVDQVRSRRGVWPSAGIDETHQYEQDLR